MAYEYPSTVIDAWDWPAQATTWRLKAEHAQQELNYWRRKTTALQAQLDLYQQREKAIA
jgi:outer membrane protease